MMPAVHYKASDERYNRATDIWTSFSHRDGCKACYGARKLCVINFSASKGQGVVRCQRCQNSGKPCSFKPGQTPSRPYQRRQGNGGPAQIQTKAEVKIQDVNSYISCNASNLTPTQVALIRLEGHIEALVHALSSIEQTRRERCSIIAEMMKTECGSVSSALRQEQLTSNARSASKTSISRIQISCIRLEGHLQSLDKALKSPYSSTGARLEIIVEMIKTELRKLSQAHGN